MERRGVIENLLPWAGMIGGGVGWALSHQIGSNSVFDDCRVDGPLVLTVCLIGLLLAALGGFASLRVWKRGGEETDGRRFVAIVGALLAALAAFAIVLQALAAIILPRCVA